MLAATRARPVGHALSSPTPAGDRLVAALAAERGRALADEPLAAAGDGRAPAARPARSAASWPQAAPTSWPRLRRIVVAIPAARSVAANASMTGIGLAGQGVWATGFIGMRLTWAWSPRSRSAIAVGVDGRCRSRRRSS